MTLIAEGKKVGKKETYEELKEETFEHDSVCFFAFSKRDGLILVF